MGFIQKEDEFGNAPQDNNKGLVQYSALSQAMREDGATQITRSGQPQDEEYLSERRFINITWRVIPSKIIQFFCSTLSFRSEIVREWCEAEFIRVDMKGVKEDKFPLDVEPLLNESSTTDVVKWDRAVRNYANESDL